MYLKTFKLRNYVICRWPLIYYYLKMKPILKQWTVNIKYAFVHKNHKILTFISFKECNS